MIAIALRVLLTIVLVAALSSSSSHIVNIVGLSGGQIQSLPTGYVQSFPRWQVDDDNRLQKFECGGVVTDLDVEWSDMLQARPSVEFLFKGGIPTYVMAGVQFRHRDSPNESVNGAVRSCPLARQWTTFAFAAEPNFRIELFEQEGSAVTAWRFGEDPAQQMQDALQVLGITASQLDEQSPLSEGFHIVSLPLQIEWADVPEPRGSGYKVSCLATAEPEASELLSIDQSLVEMTASSVLEFQVVVGGDSQIRMSGEL